MSKWSKKQYMLTFNSTLCMISIVDGLTTSGLSCYFSWFIFFRPSLQRSVLTHLGMVHIRGATGNRASRSLSLRRWRPAVLLRLGDQSSSASRHSRPRLRQYAVPRPRHQRRRRAQSKILISHGRLHRHIDSATQERRM